VYAWIWRVLPGPLAVRLLLAVLALLMIVVFPVVDPLLPFNGVSVGNP